MFERLVRSVKRCLRKAIGSKRLTYEELLTVLVEVEVVINNRPLTYIEEDDTDAPVTPSHLFCGRPIKTTADRGEEDIVMIDQRNDLTTRVRQMEEVVDHFWRRWRREYLIVLR